MELYLPLEGPSRENLSWPAT